MKRNSYVVGAVIAIAFMGSGLITPLYQIYQRAFHFSEITLTLIYAAYVLGNVLALFFFGRFSDHIGRRPVALASIALGFASMLVFLFASGTIWLYVARTISGVAVGLASGTGTAWLSDFDEDKARATMVAVASNGFGFGLGPVLAGVLAQYTRAPLKSPFYAYLPLLAAVGLLTWRARERRAPDRYPRIAELLRPRVGVPREILSKFIAPAVTAFGTFALIGFYAALVPTILAESLGEPQPVVGGFVVFELSFAAGVFAIAAKGIPSRVAMLSTLILLPISIAGLIFAQNAHSMLALVLTTGAGGLCWALGYRGSLQVINDIAPAERRAEVASSYYIVGFIGNSIPVIGIGVITSFANPNVASLTFGCTIAAFAAVALFFELRRAERAASAPRRA
jgi:MFS family permease